jgi:signal transduction histidine kinase
VAAERRPIVLENVDDAEVLNPLLREKGIKSLLGAPLQLEGQVIGVIHVGTLAPRAFATEDVELLQVAAERAALGIERARVHEELLRLDRLKLDFIAFAAHELRTPVANIRGAAMTLSRRGGELDDVRTATLVDSLDRQSERLALLVEQLLDLSRLDAGAVPIKPERFPVRERVEELVAVAGAAPGAVEIDVPTGLEAVADAIAFERIVTNLVANALRYGAPPVTITAERRDQHFRLRVADRGPGVSPEFESSLFDRFTRSEPSRRTGGGLGLGLAIARSYAHAHGGDVLYAPGEPSGASFELVLPS